MSQTFINGLPASGQNLLSANVNELMRDANDAIVRAQKQGDVSLLIQAISLKQSIVMVFGQ